MADTTLSKAAPARKAGMFVSLFLLFMGFAPFVNAASSPGFQAIPTIEVVRLMAAGGCFGAGLAILAMLLFSANSK
jgi:hypothetical protein